MFAGSLVASQIISLFWLVPLALGFHSSIPGDIEQILSNALRLDGVLLGFTVALASLILGRTQRGPTRLAAYFVTTAFDSFFLSILSGFVGLLNGKSGAPLVTLVTISFTLTGVFTMIAFFAELSLHSELTKKASQ